MKTTKGNRQTKPINQPMWAWCNWGYAIGVERTRKEAIAAAENHTGEDWAVCKSYMEVRKVYVTTDY
jgi:hypothetical protein